MLRNILILSLVSFVFQPILGMGYVRRLAAPAIAGSLVAYSPKRVLTDNKIDQEIDKLIEEQELLSPPFDGGICDDTSLKAPDDYIKIIPGKTPGFDHVKFARLKAKYLDAVNQEYWAAVEKTGVSKADLEAAELRLFEEAKVYEQGFLNDHPEVQELEPITIRAVKKSSAMICPKLRKLMIDKIKKHGLRPEHVAIQKSFEDGKSAAEVIQAVDLVPYSVLRIRKDDSYFKINNDSIMYYSDSAILISELQTFDCHIEHEISHLLHNDGLRRHLIDILGHYDRNILKEHSIDKIQEKRADIFAVFNCANPISAAILQARSKKNNDLYDHRASTEWHVMADEIRSCYSDEIQAKWRTSSLMPSLGYTVFPKIEHIHE
jgi:hypothetical protein